MGHTYSTFGPYGQALVNNANIFRAEWIKDDAFGAVINAFPSVDTFFIIGATLLTFLTLKELEKMANKGASPSESAFFWMKYYVHRYIRLTGVYAAILLFHASLIKLFATGPQSEYMMMHHESCQADWWKNLLYINNLVSCCRNAVLHNHPIANLAPLEVPQNWTWTRIHFLLSR